MLTKFKLYLSTINIWELVLGLSIEILLRIGLIWVWNFIFSAELNKFLFGTEQLGYIRGIILITVVGILCAARKENSLVNNFYNKER